MSEELKKHVAAVKDAFVEAAKEFAEEEEVQVFFTEQAELFGKELFTANTASDPADFKQAEDNMTALLGQGKSEVKRLVIAADNVARAKIEAALTGVGTLILNIVKGKLGA